MIGSKFGAPAIRYVAGESAHICVTSGPHRRRELGPHKRTEIVEAKETVDYTDLDALAAVSGPVPSLRKMRANTLAPDLAEFPLRRDDFPHSDDSRLFRYLCQQRHRDVGFDVVLAHIARVAAIFA